MRATRAQADRALYKAWVRQSLENQPNLQIFQQAVDDLLVENGEVTGVVTQIGLKFTAPSVVLTVGTFLGGRIHVGLENHQGGRAGDPPSNTLAQRLRERPFNVQRLKTGTPPVFVHQFEALSGTESFSEGREWTCGALTIRALHTSGHSAGGTTFVIDGLPQPVAIVGDALFAGSMGGGKVSYDDALKNNRDKILTLPDDTVLCPGHGPMTTVAEEKAHNPFFPEFKQPA